MDSKLLLYVVLPLIAIAVILATLFGLYSNEYVIAVVVVLYVVVSLLNRRKFARQEREAKSPAKK